MTFVIVSYFFQQLIIICPKIPNRLFELKTFEMIAQ